ncbi:MAG: hypothetical protein IJ302_01245, partial [Clostridia bacterium]|nr:hypothetical protein [Clostridia bacterium]
DGYLYFVDNGWLNFTILKSGQTQVLCFDPLCSHEQITSETTCFALAVISDMESRVLVHDGKVWFTAESLSKTPGGPTYIQLRSLDLDTMKLEVYLEKNELSITDFWFLGDEIYLSMPTMKEQEDGSIYYAGGSIYRLDKNDKLTMVLEDTEDVQFQILASGEGCVYYCGKFGDGTIYKTTPDFSYTEAVAVLPSVFHVQIYDDYVYYQRRTKNSQRAECPAVEGDFDENISIISYTHSEVSLYRMKLDGSSTEELVYASMPIARSNYVLNHRNYHIDRETGLIYLVPLEVSCKGYTIWKPDSQMLKMGAGGKDILTGYFSITNGRLIVMNAATLEIVRKYTDLGVDILDIYSIENGQLLGNFASIDPAVLDEKGAGSQKIYEYSGLIDLD